MKSRLRTRENLSASELTLLVDAIREDLQIVIKKISRKHRNKAKEYLAALNVNIDDANLLKSYLELLLSLFKFLDSIGEDASAQRIVQPLKNLLIHNLQSQHEAGWDAPDEDYDERTRIIQAIGKIEAHSFYRSSKEKSIHDKWIPEVSATPSEEDIKLWESILLAAPEAIEGNVAKFSTLMIDHLQSHLSPFSVKHIDGMFFQANQGSAVEEYTANSLHIEFSGVKQYTINKRKDVKKLQNDSTITAGFDALCLRLDDLKKCESRLNMFSARNIRILFFEILVNYLHDQSYVYSNGGQVEGMNWSDLIKSKVHGLSVHIDKIEKALCDLSKFVESEYENITAYLTEYCDSIKKLGDAGFADRIAKIEERIPYRFRTVSLYHAKRKNDTVIESTKDQFTNAVLQSGIENHSAPAEIGLFLQKIKAVQYNKYVDLEMPDWKVIEAESKDLSEADYADLPSKSIFFTVSSIPLSELMGVVNDTVANSDPCPLMEMPESADVCCEAACNFVLDEVNLNSLNAPAEINHFLQRLVKAIYISREMPIPCVKTDELINLLYDRECISDAAFVLMKDLLGVINHSGDKQIPNEARFTRMLEMVALLKSSLRLFHARKQPLKIFEINWEASAQIANDEVSSHLTGRLAAIEQAQAKLLMLIDYHRRSVNSIFYGERYRAHLINTLLEMDTIKVKLLKSYISCGSNMFNEEMQLFVTGVEQSALSYSQLKKIISPLQVEAEPRLCKFNNRRK